MCAGLPPSTHLESELPTFGNPHDSRGSENALDGGPGADLLRGGRGADIFRFRTANEADGDRIDDLGTGDRIDLSAIDAAPARGNQAFKWLGDGAFTGEPGTLRVTPGRIIGDTDGDGRADFTIFLTADAARADLIL